MTKNDWSVAISILTLSLTLTIFLGKFSLLPSIITRLQQKQFVSQQKTLSHGLPDRWICRFLSRTDRSFDDALQKGQKIDLSGDGPAVFACDASGSRSAVLVTSAKPTSIQVALFVEKWPKIYASNFDSWSIQNMAVTLATESTEFSIASHESFSGSQVLDRFILREGSAEIWPKSGALKLENWGKAVRIFATHPEFLFPGFSAKIMGETVQISPSNP